MQTYKPILIESLAAAVVGVIVSIALAPQGLGLGTLYPHPMWLAIVVLAARYGGRGLVVAGPLSWGALALTAIATNVYPAAVVHRLSSGADLGALVGVVLVSWIASMHERRHADVVEQLAAVKQRCAADQAALAELRRTAVTLRARADRLDTSLTFLRDVSQRLEGADVDAAAQAAVDLAMARLGARSAVVQVVDEGGLTPLASAGVWAPDGSGGGVSGDRTAAAALATRRPTRAVDLPEGGPGDSDLAAPIVDGRGGVAGIIAVRGVPHGGASAAALRDLAIVAGWSARALKRARPARDATADVAAAALESEPAPEDPPLALGEASGRETLPRSISQLNA